MKKVIVWIVPIFFIIVVLFCYINKKSGNNRSTTEIEKFFMNIKSYKASLDVVVKSNKNENKYSFIQEVNVKSKKQIVEAPNDIKGLEIMYKDNKLQISNSRLQLSKIYNNYEPITKNYMFLDTFVDGYKEAENREIKDLEDDVILKYNNKNNIFELLVSKKELRPKSMKIKNIDNKTKIYILYKEIEFNI